MSIPLLIADAAAVLSLVGPSQWGVYLNGVPKIVPATPLTLFATAALQPIQTAVQAAVRVAGFGALAGENILPVIASTIDFEFSQDWPISDYPQEQGAFQSYNKVMLPFDVKVKLASGGSTTSRQAFLTSCLEIANSLALFEVVTPEIVFTNCNVTHIDWRRTARNGVGLVTVDLWFKQISISVVGTFSNTQQPGDAGQQGTGVVQPQPPTPPLQGPVQSRLDQSASDLAAAGGSAGAAGGGGA